MMIRSLENQQSIDRLLWWRWWLIEYSIFLFVNMTAIHWEKKIFIQTNFHFVSFKKRLITQTCNEILSSNKMTFKMKEKKWNNQPFNEIGMKRMSIYTHTKHISLKVKQGFYIVRMMECLCLCVCVSYLMPTLSRRKKKNTACYICTLWSYWKRNSRRDFCFKKKRNENDFEQQQQPEKKKKGNYHGKVKNHWMIHSNV